MNKTLLWLGLMLMILIHVQLNNHSSLYFVLASLLCGAIPLNKMSWLKFFGIEVLTLFVCLLMQYPGSEVFMTTIGAITQMNYWLYLSITFLLSSTLFATLAYSMYFIVANPYLYSFFGIGLADKEKTE